ncbi:MAG: hypothetical protein P4K98_04745 [Bryobacteraceae bacterium]|nr:hypothetical protein [Bryobacteraceae bacterium]
MKTDVRHPDLPTLALLAGGDLPFLTAVKTRWHLHSCLNCAREFEAFRAARTELRLNSAAELQPDEVDPAWNALEAEMRANVRLGLTADSLAAGSPASESGGEVDVPAPAFSSPWRWAAVCGAVVFVLVAGWSLRSPGTVPVASAPAPEAPYTEPAGQDAKFQLLAPVADVSRTETDFDGSTRSQVIDGETGQVTLQQVYVE